jgi:predicted Zn-ribbon and HTH transcriptional regulator
MMVRCGRCGYSWEYRGKSKYYATCPCCLRKVKMINPPRRKK